MKKEDIHYIWSILYNIIEINKEMNIQDNNLVVTEKNIPLLKEVIQKTKDVIINDNELCISKEILDEFANYDIYLSMYSDYADMVVYIKFHYIGIEITRVPKKDLISYNN